MNDLDFYMIEDTDYFIRGTHMYISWEQREGEAWIRFTNGIYCKALEIIRYREKVGVKPKYE